MKSLFFLSSCIFFVLFCQVTDAAGLLGSLLGGVFDSSNTGYQDQYGTKKKGFEVDGPLGSLRFGEESSNAGRQFNQNDVRSSSNGFGGNNMMPSAGLGGPIGGSAGFGGPIGGGNRGPMNGGGNINNGGNMNGGMGGRGPSMGGGRNDGGRYSGPIGPYGRY